MALDEALMERARMTGESVFRVYSWSEPTLSLGRNQPARMAYDMPALRQRGFAVVRRPTGGRAILHHREVTYSVTAPAAGAGDTRESYDEINRLLVDGLRGLGVEADIVGSIPGASAPGPIPCFAHPSAGELVHRGRKLVGSAQWRCDNALLQHGSILLEDDQTMLSSLLLEASAPPAEPATLRSALGYVPPLDDVANSLFDAVRRRHPSAAVLAPDRQLADLAAAALPRFVDDAWTWRR
jgi:lipoate-protein ligase A